MNEQSCFNQGKRWKYCGGKFHCVCLVSSMSYPYNRKCPCVVGYVYVSYNADNKEDIEVKFDLKEPPYFCVGNIVLVI